MPGLVSGFVDVSAGVKPLHGLRVPMLALWINTILCLQLLLFPGHRLVDAPSLLPYPQWLQCMFCDIVQLNYLSSICKPGMIAPRYIYCTCLSEATY